MHCYIWLPVHVRDMTTLSAIHLDVLSEFMFGKRVLNTANNNFSISDIGGNYMYIDC